MIKNKYKKYIILRLITIGLVIYFLLPLIHAENLIFKQNEYVNYRFRCLDENNNYCNSGTILTISIESPNGTNILDNLSMTYNPTYFNVSLPTNLIGEYNSIIISPTSNGTVSEFKYIITYTGQQVSLSNIIIVIAFLFIAGILFLLGYTFDKDQFILKSAFYLFSLIMLLISLNSGRIIASESTGLDTMSIGALILLISVIAFFFLYIFIMWTVNTFKLFKTKKEMRWKY